MRLLARVGSPQAAITALTGITALYMGLVVFGNVTDYDTNHAFVQHVFAMDTTGYGRSTRPAAMNDPCNLSAAQQIALAPDSHAEPCAPSYGQQMTTMASGTTSAPWWTTCGRCAAPRRSA